MAPALGWRLAGTLKRVRLGGASGLAQLLQCADIKACHRSPQLALLLGLQPAASDCSHAVGPCVAPHAEDEVVGMPSPIEEEVAELPPQPLLPSGTTGLKNIGE